MSHRIGCSFVSRVAVKATQPVANPRGHAPFQTHDIFFRCVPPVTNLTSVVAGLRTPSWSLRCSPKSPSRLGDTPSPFSTPRRRHLRLALDAFGVEASCLWQQETDTGGDPLNPIYGSAPGRNMPKDAARHWIWCGRNFIALSR